MAMYLIVACGAVIAVQAILHYIERRELYNRIMSRDLTEYREKRPSRAAPSAHERILKRWRGKDGETG